MKANSKDKIKQMDEKRRNLAQYKMASMPTPPVILTPGEQESPKNSPLKDELISR